jgi:hypothetical protein
MRRGALMRQHLFPSERRGGGPRVRIFAAIGGIRSGSANVAPRADVLWQVKCSDMN